MKIQEFPNSVLTPTGLSPNTLQLCQTTCQLKYPNWCMHTCVYKNTQLTVDRNTSIPNICSTYLNWILSKYNQLCLDEKMSPLVQGEYLNLQWRSNYTNLLLNEYPRLLWMKPSLNVDENERYKFMTFSRL